MEVTPLRDATGEGYEVHFFQHGLVNTHIASLATGDRSSSVRRHAEYLEYLNAIQLLVHAALLRHAKTQLDLEEITIGHAFGIGKDGCGLPARTIADKSPFPAWMRPVLPPEGLDEVIDHTHRIFAEPVLRALLAQLSTAACDFYDLNFQAAGTQLNRVIEVLSRLFRERYRKPDANKKRDATRRRKLWEDKYGAAPGLLKDPRDVHMHNKQLLNRATQPFTDELLQLGFAMACAALQDLLGIELRIGGGWGYGPWLQDE